MKKATKFDKQQVLRIFFEMMILNGNDITDYMGKPLSYYNYTYLIDKIIELALQIDYYDDNMKDVILDLIEKLY